MTGTDNWIKVSSDPARMPEDGQRVFVRRDRLSSRDTGIARRNGEVIWYAGVKQHGDRKYNLWIGRGGYEHGTVSHWQPLPPPPAGTDGNISHD